MNTKSDTKNSLIFRIVMLAALCLLTTFDRLTKVWAVSSLKGSDSIEVIKGFLSFTYVENRGAAWGVLSGRINILVIITLLTIPLFIYLIYRAERSRSILEQKKLKYLRLFELDMILLTAGAVGNLIDRIAAGYVVDFLQFTFIDFPVFNAADCYITVGAVLFVILYLFLLGDDDMSIVLNIKKNEDKANDEIPG